MPLDPSPFAVVSPASSQLASPDSAAPRAQARGAALVLNTKARQGDIAPAEIVALLARHGVTARFIEAGDGGPRAAIQQAVAGGYDTVIVGGGDGTLSTAAHELCSHAICIGVLPLGTANDFARSIGIPHDDLDAACAIIATRETIAVDVGVANERRYLNVASIGLPARVTATLTPDLKKRWGVLAYLIAAAQAAIRQRPFTVRLTVDGKKRRVRRVMQLAIGSGRYFGGGLSVTEAARCDDGLLNLHVITAPNLLALLWTLRHLRSGRYAKGDSALRFRAHTVRVETRRRQRVNIDGELAGHTPLDVQIRPGCLRVFAPRQEQEQPDTPHADPH